MKKLILLLIVCASFTSQAQTHAAFGLKGGLNRTNLNTEELDLADFHSKTSFHLGCLLRIYLDEQFAIQPELLFSGQGAEFKTNYQADDLPDTENKWYLNYLNVPVLGQYLFGKGFCLETGPQAGFLLNAKMKNEFDEQDIIDQLKGFDFSWNFGAGYQAKFGLGLGVRYNLGLSDINDSFIYSTTSNPIPTPISIKNRVLQLNLFYTFVKRHKK